MLDAYIIEKIKEEENRRRDDRRPRLQIPVYIEEEFETDHRRQDPETGDKKETTPVIEY